MTGQLRLDSSFISTQFFVLNLDGWFGTLSNKFVILNIPLLFCYTTLNSSIICCLFSRNLHLSFVTSISSSFFERRSAECNFFLKILMHLLFYQQFYYQLNPQLLLLFNCSFWRSFYCVCCRFFSTIKKFLTIFIA